MGLMTDPVTGQQDSVAKLQKALRHIATHPVARVDGDQDALAMRDIARDALAHGLHVDLMARDPLSAAGPRFVKRLPVDDPSIGKSLRDGDATYAYLSEPHTMAACPFLPQQGEGSSGHYSEGVRTAGPGQQGEPDEAEPCTCDDPQCPRHRGFVRDGKGAWRAARENRKEPGCE